MKDFPLLEADFYVLRPAGAYVPAKVRALIDSLVEIFDGKPIWDLREPHPTSLRQ